jgi:hypothetical protein
MTEANSAHQRTLVVDMQYSGSNERQQFDRATAMMPRRDDSTEPTCLG